MVKTKLKIRLVDGFKIRNTLDPEFGVFHQSGLLASAPARKFYIPGGECWLDHRHQDERDFFRRVEEIEPPAESVTFTEWRAHIKKVVCLPPPIPKFVLSRENREGQTLVLVNGRIIRQYLDPEFILAGHGLVYSYITENEIWLDAAMDPDEIPYIFLHEIVERQHMTPGESYDIAHDYATAAEKGLRRSRLGTRYPLDDDYPWYGKTNEELAQEYYVK